MGPPVTGGLASSNISNEGYMSQPAEQAAYMTTLT